MSGMPKGTAKVFLLSSDFEKKRSKFMIKTEKVSLSFSIKNVSGRITGSEGEKESKKKKKLRKCSGRSDSSHHHLFHLTEISMAFYF